ncbi:methylenetetrahydrofolate reductase (NADPH) [Pseudarthrobacter enclensis]|uniref:Methylenetetrahydrofolate reductase n=1 Tax=Pseudarthrobacter enclensis TaxID=993070 RepID=A0A0V8I6L5_9MICC|nr:methylenetetrahydrofolate reductase [Pseudarthrobacter enclensis]KSU70001.1 5,10-methylenetetrahydrofolate reductase [Pseudarthrobacter enclensis]SCC29976.1 methylenetetrahydrofolate reductase (NADPH) [Pseudarthrobacter enclensis]
MSAEPEASSTGGLNSGHSALIDGYSLEMTGKDVPGLLEAKESIPAGTRINVTFLGNESLEMRLAAANSVRELGFVPVPHISARRISSQHQLEEFLDALHQARASENVFIIGGDPARPEGPYEDSSDLIRTGLLTKYGVKQVGIAGYPEGHPDIGHEKLWNALTEKTTLLKDQGLESSIVTQFAFDTDPVIDWIEDVRALGITSEIRVGTPGPAGIRRLLGFARRFGIGANAMIAKKYGFSLTNLMGTAGPDKFVTELSERLDPTMTTGPVKLHFYTFGGLEATSNWAKRYKTQRQN